MNQLILFLSGAEAKGYISSNTLYIIIEYVLVNSDETVEYFLKSYGTRVKLSKIPELNNKGVNEIIEAFSYIGVEIPET